MRSIVALLLVGLAQAARVSDEEQVTGQWLTHSKRFCMSSDAEVKCKADESIRVFSAFLAEVWAAKCGNKAAGGEPTEPCVENVTDAVMQICQGRASCKVPSTTYSAPCHAQKSSVRIVWNCAATPPVKDEEPEEEWHDAKGPAEDEEEWHDARGPAEEEEKWHDAEDEEWHDARSEVHAHPDRAAGDASKLMAEVQGDEEHEVTFNPCYRKTRVEMLKEAKWYAALTLRSPTCPTGEDCYQLTWSDGKEFKDESQPPTNAEILQASISKSASDGVTLKTNNIHTWGVCLPMRKSVDFMVAFFNDLKSHWKY